MSSTTEDASMPDLLRDFLLVKREYWWLLYDGDS